MFFVSLMYFVAYCLLFVCRFFIFRFLFFEFRFFVFPFFMWGFVFLLVCVNTLSIVYWPWSEETKCDNKSQLRRTCRFGIVMTSFIVFHNITAHSYHIQSLRTNCNGTGGRPPVTLAEMTLDANGQDYYDVSNVDGFNLPVAMYPIQGTVTPRPGADPKYECTTAGCTKDINAVCPSNIEGKNLQVRSGSAVVACKSGCEAHQDDLHCCRGAHNVPENCPSTRTSNWFKMQCPDAYSYAYDDKASTFFCTSRNGLGSSGYHIVFCPSGGSPPTIPGPSGNTRCGCSSCTSSIYNKNAGGHSVVSRIDWLKSNRNISEIQACKQVCGDEFPNVCGRECQPSICSPQPSNTRCGCSSCISSVYNKYADGHKVVSRIDWVKANRNLSETQACRLVCGNEYPNVCGKECNPSRCSSTRLNNGRS